MQKTLGNEFRTTMICVDAFGPDRFSGRIFNPYLDGGEVFTCLMQMLLKMDTLLDQMRFPQSFAARREFSPTQPQPVGTESAEGAAEGKLATFAVRVMFRQNASWQGSVQWLEGGREESFRSVLELLFLINSALDPQK
ncbi:MAG: hypothetical protein LKJ86_03980 [Oscillibacter sp.]|jgi:hypothetical protein|nr:hypothetical protein [Oscillibacter sp.]